MYLQYLDKVEVEMRTCEEPRPPNGQSPIALAAGQRSDLELHVFLVMCYWGMGVVDG